MRDLPFDETLLPAPLELAPGEARCSFCRGRFKVKATGRPAAFCSTRCRQAEHRERQGAGYGHGSSPRRRRVDCRLENELEQLLAAGELAGFAARAEAARRASDAWPFEAFDPVRRRRLEVTA